MEKKQIYFDQRKYNQKVTTLNYCVTKLQGVVTEFLNVIKVRPVKLEEIKSCFNIAPNGDRRMNAQKLELLLFDGFVEDTEEKSLFGLKIDKKKVRELISFPDLQKLTEALQELEGLLPGGESNLPWDFFLINEGKVIINELQLSTFRESCIDYAETTNELKRLESAERVIKDLGELAVLAPELKIENMAIPGVITWDFELKKLRPRVDFVKAKEIQKFQKKMLAEI